MVDRTHLRNPIAELNWVSNSFALRIPKVCHGPLIDAKLIGKRLMLINTMVARTYHSAWL